LAVSPLFSDFYEWLIIKVFGSTLFNFGTFQYNVPGVRVTLLAGGIIIIIGGLISRSQVVHVDIKSKKKKEISL